jgi:hypothetical protein
MRMTTRRWRTMGQIMRRIYVAEAKHAHDSSVRLSQLPLAPAVSASASNLAQSREADDLRCTAARW